MKMEKAAIVSAALQMAVAWKTQVKMMSIRVVG
jgi:hypothetical protein